MRSRGLIGIIALLGVLLHAGALVRHNGMMLSALLQYQALVADLTAICHGTGTPADTELPYLPRPTDAEFGCPVCSGLVAAFVLPAAEPVAFARPLPDRQGPPPRHFERPGIERLGLPPARGPPILA